MIQILAIRIRVRPLFQVPFHQMNIELIRCSELWFENTLMAKRTVEQLISNKSEHRKTNLGLVQFLSNK